MSCEIFRECYQNREHGGVFEDTLHITQQSCQAVCLYRYLNNANKTVSWLSEAYIVKHNTVLKKYGRVPFAASKVINMQLHFLAY